MSVRVFAAHTNLSTYSITEMEAKGERAQLRPSTQEVLDQALANASDQVRQRFCAILGPAVPIEHSRSTETDTHAPVVTSLGTAPGRDPLGSSPEVKADSSRLNEATLLPGADVTTARRHDSANNVQYRELAMAAGDSADFLRRAGVAVSTELLDQLRSEVDTLAIEYLRQPPYAIFPSINALRREVFTLLDQHVPTQHLSDLYVCAGQLTALLAHASADLGQPVVAEAHARAAWLCAELAGHDPLRAYVRWVQANIAYWAGNYQQAAQIAVDGRRHAGTGTSLLRLASQEARAWAAYGDQRAVEQALAAATDARDQLPKQAGEVGAFHFSAGKASYYAAEARLVAGDQGGARRARHDAEEAHSLLTAEPQPCLELVAAAQLDLAAAHIALQEIEHANGALAQVLQLPVERRTVPVAQRATKIGHALSSSKISVSPVAADLLEQIHLFLAYPATHEITN